MCLQISAPASGTLLGETDPAALAPLLEENWEELARDQAPFLCPDPDWRLFRTCLAEVVAVARRSRRFSGWFPRVRPPGVVGCGRGGGQTVSQWLSACIRRNIRCLPAAAGVLTYPWALRTCVALCSATIPPQEVCQTCLVTSLAKCRLLGVQNDQSGHTVVI